MGIFIFGISNRLEQVIANLLDNSISFSKDNQKIEIYALMKLQAIYCCQLKMRDPVLLKHHLRKYLNVFIAIGLRVLENILALGLNIVKNIVQLHKGTIAASNRLNAKGAQVEVLLPKLS